MGMEKPPIHSTTTTIGDGKPVTTFVHTNTNAFREVVQRLTGPSETKEGDQATTKVVTATTTTTTTTNVKRTTTKLHERRKCMKPKLEIVKPSIHYKNGTTCLSSPSSKSSGSCSTSHLPSPTTPSTLFSQLTLFEDEKKVVPQINIEEEEKAIKERRFYLHPSPRSKPDGYNQPELLNLFPLASPTTSETL